MKLRRYIGNIIQVIMIVSAIVLQLLGYIGFETVLPIIGMGLFIALYFNERCYRIELRKICDDELKLLNKMREQLEGLET